MKIIFIIPIFFSMLPILAHDNFIHINHLGCDWHFDTKREILLTRNNTIKVRSQSHDAGIKPSYTFSNKSDESLSAMIPKETLTIGDFNIKLFKTSPSRDAFVLTVENIKYDKKLMRIAHFGSINELKTIFWKKFNLCQTSYHAPFTKSNEITRYIVAYECGEECKLTDVKVMILPDDYYPSLKKVQEVHRVIDTFHMMNDPYIKRRLNDNSTSK